MRARIIDSQPVLGGLDRQRMRILAIRIVDPSQRAPPIIGRHGTVERFGAIDGRRRLLRAVRQRSGVTSRAGITTASAARALGEIELSQGTTNKQKNEQRMGAFGWS